MKSTPESPPTYSASTDSRRYERKKQRAKLRSRELVLAGQDIAPIPPVADLARRSRADTDFRYFCETYFPQLFCIPWSEDHLRVIGKIERTVIGHETFAVAMPRGSGKTTLCQVAVIWAIVTGRHSFVFLIAATAEYATNLLDNIKTLLATNDLLYADYPEAIHPIRGLDGESRRCSGQRHYGRLTQIEWSGDKLVLATVPNARCSGATIRVAGLTGNIRGAVHTRSDGTSVRPSLVVIDDPQTDQSARSVTQCHERLAIINGAILGLAGPQKSVAVIMPCTVIRSEDVADKILDPESHPQWQGERTQMVYRWPTNEKLWAEYCRLRSESFRTGGKGESATDYYCQNRAMMDEGALVAWEQRFNEGELSAIQHAMNLKQDRGEVAFYAEYQNQPVPELQPGGDLLTAEQIAAKTNGIDRGLVPLDAGTVTLFVDVHLEVLYWILVAWKDDFTGFVIDYGTEPDQREPYFQLRNLRRTLAHAKPGAGMEGALYAGLERLCDRTLGRELKSDDGGTVRIARCLIDANWSASANVIYQFCRQSKYAQVLTPSIGRYVGAASTPFSEFHKRPGERIGLNWRYGRLPNGKVKRITFDTNYWKTHVHARLAVAMGDEGCVSLFGDKSELHQLFAEHLTSEYRVQTEGRGRKLDEWKLRAGGLDNHWLDCLVGAAVGASMEGCSIPGTEPTKSPKQRSYAERYKEWKEKVGNGPRVFRW